MLYFRCFLNLLALKMSPRLWILFFFRSGRPFPVILPHELLPWLMRNGAFPKVSCSDLASYWDHIDARSIPVGGSCEWWNKKTKCQSIVHLGWWCSVQCATRESDCSSAWSCFLTPTPTPFNAVGLYFASGKLTWPLNLVDVGKLKKSHEKTQYLYI